MYVSVCVYQSKYGSSFTPYYLIQYGACSGASPNPLHPHPPLVSSPDPSHSSRGKGSLCQEGGSQESGEDCSEKDYCSLISREASTVLVERNNHRSRSECTGGVLSSNDPVRQEPMFCVCDPKQNGMDGTTRFCYCDPPTNDHVLTFLTYHIFVCVLMFHRVSCKRD
ncbi:hypothetical protein GBAR_LOCUS31809, partial [Geodia barretti]